MKTMSVLASIIIILLTLGCKSELIVEMDTLTPTPTPTSLSYLALGDSYTIGEGVSEPERYPVQLKDSLSKAGITIEQSQIVARTGWTTNELSAGIDNANPTPPFNLVTLLIGVNNQYRGRSLENYREEFTQLLERAILFAGGDKSKVIVVSIPDWGVTPFAAGRDREKIAIEIDAFNAVNFEETNKIGVAYIDVTPISREATTRPELIAPDGLHPSGLMYKYWVELLFTVAYDILKPQL